MRLSAVQVGDVLIVDSDTHTVEEISLSTTVMRRWARMLCQSSIMTPNGACDTAHPVWMLRRRSDGARLWYPNAKLSQNAVINISRSENKSERFKVSSIAPRLVPGLPAVVCCGVCCGHGLQVSCWEHSGQPTS